MGFASYRPIIKLIRNGVCLIFPIIEVIMHNVLMNVNWHIPG